MICEILEVEFKIQCQDIELNGFFISLVGIFCFETNLANAAAHCTCGLFDLWSA